MTQRINNTIVPEALYDKAMSLRHTGGRSFLLLSDPHEIEQYSKQPIRKCSNCCNTGTVGLQWIVGGPFDTVPSGSGGDAKVPKVATQFEGKWWLVKNKMWTCPVCKVN